jgi:hypothetical protein
MCRIVAVTLALIAGSLGGFVEAAGERHIIRFGGTHVMPTGDLTEEVWLVEDPMDGMIPSFFGDATIEPQSGTGLALEYEYRWSELIGLDFALWSAEHDVDVRLRGTLTIIDELTGEVLVNEPIDETGDGGDLTVSPLIGGVNFHLTNGSRVDFYVGPFVAYVTYGDLEDGSDSFGVDSDFGYGAVVGIDIPIGSGRWAFSSSARYMETEAGADESAGADGIDVNPVIVQLAAAYRF